jgi:hypothetical protein
VKPTKEDVPRGFTELGKVLTTCRLPFQGPDIDSYLRCALEVDFAQLMTELGDGTSHVEASAQAVASARTGVPSEFKHFNAEGYVRA